MRKNSLDDWLGKKNTKPDHTQSILSEELLIRHSLKERILDLEKMRDQIMYELDRLKEVVEGKKL
jgi:hypothetical protein